MTNIGETLRAAREGFGLSLAEVEAATRIRARFLEALEQNDFDALGGDVYVRGFLRNYADFLGLDTDELIALYGPVANPIPPRESSEPRYLAEPLQSNPIPIGRILFTLTVLILVGALSVMLWTQPDQRDALLARVGLLTPTATPTVTAIPAADAGAVRATATARSLGLGAPTATPTLVSATPVPTATLPPRTPTPDPAATATAEPTAVPQPQGVVVQAEIVADSWVRVIIDSQPDPVIERTLQAGESFEWVGQEAITLRTGNAGGLRLTLNGEVLGELGAPGEVVERRWERNPDGGPPIVAEPPS